MKRILICYSWSVNNIGDIAITPGLLAQLRRHFPEAGISLVSNLGKDSADFARWKAYLAQRWPTVELHHNPFLPTDGERMGRLERAARQQWGDRDCDAFDQGMLPPDKVDAIVHWLRTTLVNEVMSTLEKKEPLFISALRDASLLIYNSGTTLNYGRGEPFPAKIGEVAPDKRNFWGLSLIRAMPMVLAQANNIPFLVNGQSFDALDYPMDRFLRPVFEGAQRVLARDPDSLDYLRRKGLALENSAWGPDSTFFFPGRDDDWATAFLGKHGLEDRKFMAVIIRTSIQGYISEAREAQHLQTLRMMLEAWVERTGMRILLCPEVRTELSVMRQKVYEWLPPSTQQKCVCMDDFWTTDEATSVYAKAAVVTSMEMHSIILALSAGAPVLHPQFVESGRKAAMLREISLEDWIFDIDHVTPYEILTKAEEILGDQALARQRVAKGMEHVRQTAEATMAFIKSLARH